MIVTLTANPSVDRTVEVERLVRGEVLRARAVRVDPGGKGVNVARALAANGHPACAVLPAGGAEGRQLVALLEAAAVAVVAVPVGGAIRANIGVVEPDGTTTKINEPGPALSVDELEALTAALVGAGRGASWVVLSGSLPPGAPADLYAHVVRAVRAEGTAAVAVDTSGAALGAVLAAGPDLIKPNREELAEAVGRPLERLGDVLEAASELRARGAGGVLASLGADGAVLVDASGVHYGTAPVAQPRSTVGAGDALLAGALSVGGRGPAALAEALAWGAAAAALPGSQMPAPADLRRSAVVLHDRPDHTMLLGGPVAAHHH